MGGHALRAREDSMRSRWLLGTSGRTLDFTVRQGAMKRSNLLRFSIAALTAAWHIGLGGTQSALSLLNELRQELRSVRSLPAGTKVSVPDKNLAPLLGLSSTEIQRSLGWPTYCGHEETWSIKGTDCSGKTFWRYSWGPLSPAPNSAGPGHIVVTAGGPPLLVLDFQADKVSGARWEEQR